MSSYTWIDKTTELESAFNSDISLNPIGDDCGGGGAYIQSIAYDSISKKLYSGGFYSSKFHGGDYEPFVCSSTTGGSTWTSDASNIWQAFNGDISFNSCGGGFVAALAYDTSNNKLFAGGQYSSQFHAGSYEPFVCSLNDASGSIWNKDASNIWQAFGTDIAFSNSGGGGGYVSALAYDSSASKIFAGGSYSSTSNTNAYVPFVCSATNGGSTWSTTDASNIWQAFNGDISLNNGGGGGGGYVAALAYDSSNNKLFAGGVYSSKIHAGNYEPFVCSSSNNGITWAADASSIWQAFGTDIAFSNGGGGGAVYTVAYNSGNNKLFAGGYYSSTLYAGNYELFVCSSSNNGITWNADVSSIWQAFSGDISFNNPDGGGYVSSLTYDSSNNKLYAGGLYSSNLYAGSYEPFVCSLADGSSTWMKENIPNSGSGGSIRAVVIDDVIAVGNDELGNPIMYITTINDIPIFPICFPAGTPIQTDQGIIAIERINPDIHTINKKPIIDITKTITLDKYLIGFKKNALEKNYPTDNTLMSQEHKVYYQGKMREAKTFLSKFEKVVKVKYNGEILYNVLMEDYSQMRVNNLICETLHPDSTVAKLYTKKGKYTDDVRDNIIVVMLKECIQKKDYESYNRIIGRC
jgi:hypothetical protein